MAVPGLRNIADARQRLMASPESQAAWAALDCGFAVVADVFDECLSAAGQVLTAAEMPEYLAAARTIGKLGRGPEPLLAFLEHWPDVARQVPQALALPALMAAIRSLQKSPNAPAVTPLLQTLAAVIGQLRSADGLADYLRIALELADRTSGSIHGHQITEPSPALPEFFRSAPQLLAIVPLAGVRQWMLQGIRLTAQHPAQQRDYFALRTPESRRLLERERSGTLFADVERRLSLGLHALWADDSLLVPYSTAFAGHRQQPYLAADGLRLPDVLTDRPGSSGLARYRLMLAHMAGHRRWSQPLIADNWSPMQRLAVEALEDARIDCLLLRLYPGLTASLLAAHPQPLPGSCDAACENTLRHRLTRLSRACIDPAGTDPDPLIDEFAGRFRHCLADGAASTRAVAEIALAYAARSRLPSDQYARVHFADTEIDYRDDNRHLWIHLEAGDEEESFEPPPSAAASEPDGLPPRHYPEWDEAAQTWRPDWVAVYEALHPPANAADIDALLARHAPLARRLKRLLDLLKPQERVRIRHQENGSELDLDVAVRAWTDWRSGHLPDPRIQVSHRTAGRDISVLLLIDLSQSLNATLPGGQQSILDTAREAVALLAWAIDELGDACAIAGFHSNTRHEVRYHHIKGFSEAWGDPVKARLAGVSAGWSTRMGAALRHAGRMLSVRRSEKRILLVLTDGEPADIDVSDPDYLLADARKAVGELAGSGIDSFCLSLDPGADAYVGRIFGRQWRILDRIERLPEQLPMVYLNLTR
ncbi:nitric oxide reductase activation protein NorD [Azonexus hydrophilus]|uniref:nitric oxide reductase activation protein NorD n=1 Tax=Azonexus hydrophilus TaxID=418702 RepID=UPI0003F9E064|nr:nitric oxide reductase activation protein NorD [Azonexus hydrophilus]